MRIHLDWLQYKQNFREPVLVLQTAGEQAEGPGSMEIRIDSRQVTPGSLRDPLKRALEDSNPGSTQGPDRIYLEEFRSFRSSIAWEFNRLYWQRLKDWEQATGQELRESASGWPV